MKFGTWALAAGLLAISGCGLTDRIGNTLHGIAPVRGSGAQKSESRKVGAFTKISSKGAADVHVTIGPTQSVVVRTDANLLPIVSTKVEGGELIIEPTKPYTSSGGVVVTIVVPKLIGLSLLGSGNATVSRLSSPSFNVSLAGSGNVTLDGVVSKFESSITGSGDVRAYGLAADTVDASVQGSGNSEVAPKRTLKASIQGSGNIEYKGAPKVDAHVLGSGSVQSAN